MSNTHDADKNAAVDACVAGIRKKFAVRVSQGGFPGIAQDENASVRFAAMFAGRIFQELDYFPWKTTKAFEKLFKELALDPIEEAFPGDHYAKKRVLVRLAQASVDGFRNLHDR